MAEVRLYDKTAVDIEDLFIDEARGSESRASSADRGTDLPIYEDDNKINHDIIFEDDNAVDAVSYTHLDVYKRQILIH